ncbi:Tat binding protein 1-interacting protein-domain-containing protein [Lipomyces arxii]|uniref:Tat binding protein 1-interacting protein-domain-containing protein n=1 Tax=Lipomyces arxii TaxID=56418 RepID=UPI0034CEDC4B
MVAKKEKSVAVTVDEAEAKVLAYMITQNRPYAATDVFQNLHGSVPRPAINRALASLETSGQLEAKTFGKQVIYVARQKKDQSESADSSQVSGLAPNKSVEELEQELADLTAENETLNKHTARLKAELVEVQKTPTTADLQKLVSDLDEQIETVSKKLDFLTANASGGSGIEILSAAAATKMRKDLSNMLTQWTKRRKMFNEIWAAIRENVPNAKELWDELGLEDDTEKVEDVRRRSQIT